MKPIKWFFFLLSIFLMSSCAGIAQPTTPDEKLGAEISAQEPIMATATPSSTHLPSKTPTMPPTATPTQSQTATSTAQPPTETPEPLDFFSSSTLYQGVTPVSYLEDPCIYLENRWGEGKSAPGTIVVPIMFHSIAKPGREITDSTTISTAYFEYFMQTAKEMGFDTITMNELVGFLEENKAIPERAMILILDDRRPGVTELFMPYLEANDWTLTLAWITTEKTNDALWTHMETLAESGRLDVQSHGHDHIYIQPYTPLEEIEEEIYRPIEIIEDHFDTKPVSIIWPGGNFNALSVKMAEEAGLKLGFTVYSRGPLLFNWIPQGEPEMALGKPLFTLPRYWSTAADVALRQAVTMSEEAKKNAEAVKSDELRYYSLYCQPPESE